MTNTNRRTKMIAISYESKGFSGTKSFFASDDAQALALFDACWSEFGDPIPTRWVSARWKV